MPQDEYKKVELPAIEQLKQLGWAYIHGGEGLFAGVGV